jgi:hypothetical protein
LSLPGQGNRYVRESRSRVLQNLSHYVVVDEVDAERSLKPAKDLAQPQCENMVHNRDLGLSVVVPCTVQLVSEYEAVDTKVNFIPWAI